MSLAGRELVARLLFAAVAGFLGAGMIEKDTHDRTHGLACAPIAAPMLASERILGVADRLKS